MCVRGLVISIESTILLAREIVNSGHYLLTYKTSQDHLELFFNGIRQSGQYSE
jgi:hypothetical protein